MIKELGNAVKEAVLIYISVHAVLGGRQIATRHGSEGIIGHKKACQVINSNLVSHHRNLYPDWSMCLDRTFCCQGQTKNIANKIIHDRR